MFANCPECSGIGRLKTIWKCRHRDARLVRRWEIYLCLSCGIEFRVTCTEEKDNKKVDNGIAGDLLGSDDYEPGSGA